MDFAACGTKCEPHLINILGLRASIKDNGYLQRGKKYPRNKKIGKKNTDLFSKINTPHFLYRNLVELCSFHFQIGSFSPFI